MNNEKNPHQIFKFSDGKQNLQFHWPKACLLQLLLLPSAHYQGGELI
jgi:hypothetical protein